MIIAFFNPFSCYLNIIIPNVQIINIELIFYSSGTRTFYNQLLKIIDFLFVSVRFTF